MRTFTEEQIQTLWLTMRKEFGFKLKPKSKSWSMKLVARIMDRRARKDKSLMSGREFMRDVWTTVGRTVYYCANSVPGRGNTDELRGQVLLACHEPIHVLQKLGLRYLLSPARVAKAETDAFIATMEAWHWISDEVLNPKKLAGELAAYGCNDDQIEYAQTKYIAASKMIRRGLYRSSTVKTAIRALS
jgi:hypothetical protein